MNADIIFVVSDGQVVEQGSHDELITKGGKYAELWSKQIFLKPKEPKEEDENTSEATPKTASECTETEDLTGDNAITDSKTNDESNGQANGKSNGQINGKSNGKSNGQANGKSNGQAAATRNGHKREVDRSKDH